MFGQPCPKAQFAFHHSSNVTGKVHSVRPVKYAVRFKVVRNSGSIVAVIQAGLREVFGRSSFADREEREKFR